MDIQTVNALMKMRQGDTDESFKLQVYRCGVSAVPVTEVAIHQAQHGADSVEMVSVAGSYETSKREEYERLQRKFKPEVLALVYPSAGAPMPKTIDDLDLERDQIDVRVAPPTPEPTVEPTKTAAKQPPAVDPNDIPGQGTKAA